LAVDQFADDARDVDLAAAGVAGDTCGEVDVAAEEVVALVGAAGA
jgi:hypothetical protein